MTGEESIAGSYLDPIGKQADARVAGYKAIVDKVNPAPKRTSDDPAEVRAARWDTKQRILY